MWTQARRSREGLTRHKFRCQKCHAERRGISFHFSFEEWVQWWEANLGLNWEKLRGNKLGQYVMGRKGDVGPYHPNNVMCITNTDNSKMARAGDIQTAEQRFKNSLANRGSGNARAKLTDSQAIEIYNATGTISELARNYGVSRPVIKGIKTGKNWTHITGASQCG